MSDYPELSSLMRQIKDVNRAQSEMIQSFERGKEQGFLNVNHLKDYNRQLDDYKRKLGDIARLQRSMSSVSLGPGSAPGSSAGAPGVPTKAEVERLDKYAKTTKDIERQRRASERAAFGGASSVVRSMASGRFDMAGEVVGNYLARQRMPKNRLGRYGMYAGLAGLGALGYGFAQTMAGANYHTQFQMARGTTERMGGDVFAPTRKLPGASWSRRLQLMGKMHHELNSPSLQDQVDEGSLVLKHHAHPSWGVAKQYRLKVMLPDELKKLRATRRKRIMGKYKKMVNPDPIPGELGQYESYAMSLGYGIPEAHQFAQGGLRALPGNRLRGMRSNLAMMRGYSLDAGTLYGFHRSARSGGYEGGAGSLNRELINAFTKGKFPRALMGEFVQAATSVLDTYSASGGIVTPRSAANMLSVMANAMGQGYRNDPSRTGQFINRFSSGIRSPGGGDAGKAFQYRAFGLGRGASLWDVMKRSAEGATPENVRSILDYGTKNYGKYTKFALKDIYNLTPQQVEKLLEGYRSGKLSDSAIQQVVKGPSEFAEGGKFRGRMGFRGLELQKMAEQAQAAAKNIKAVNTAYQANILAIKGSTMALNGFIRMISWFTPGSSSAPAPGGKGPTGQAK